MRIELYNYMNSGWVAFDDVSLQVAYGDGDGSPPDPVVPNPGFETSGGWSEIVSPDWPGTSIWRGTWGTADQHSGEYAYAISNHAYGYLRSDAVAVRPNTEYDVYAWVRGELDDESHSNWYVRVYFYDSGGAQISNQNVAWGGPGSLNTTWQEKGGTITTPSNAATMRVMLLNHLNSGWVAFDDVRVVAHSQVTKYYYAAGQRVAMRQNGTLTYLHGDHLGSTSLSTDAGGQPQARVLYYPYGEERYTEGTLPTDYTYTGQRVVESLGGLMDYNARYYDPYLNRFISPDTIIPDTANPQDLNRYAYVRNNPMLYTDFSGNRPCGPACREDITTDELFRCSGTQCWNQSGPVYSIAPQHLRCPREL
jgi:RHS repeat-associated protein